MSPQLPLCVDLDGTLVFADTMYEAALKALKNHPGIVWRWPAWAMKGKAYFKEQICKRAQLQVEMLPYNQDLLAYLRQQKKQGRPLILASGTHHTIAQAVADHLGIFSEVIATSGERNLAGEHKAEALNERFGHGKYAYAGNSSADLPVWKQAAEGIVVNASDKVIAQAKKLTTVINVFPRRRVTADTVRRALRVHQWVKNILIFIPLLMAHRLLNIPQLSAAIFGFIAFCSTASSIYIVNDLFDIEADRQHPRKRYRPFAAGTLTIPQGLKLWLGLNVISLAIALFLPWPFFVITVLYAVINLAYSLYLKQIAVIDVLLLASVYTLRIYAGAEASSVAISHWLLAFSMFLFISLALIKRYVELDNLHQTGKHLAAGRGYTSGDRALIFRFGLASAAVCLGVLAFYVTGDAVRSLYSRPFVLWLMLPLFGAWLARVWWLVKANKVHEDPIVFAMTDTVSYATGLLAALVLWAAI
jgi:4-hydroxybenzoate polyprenyltransferase/phosphoserine phosphatase